MDNSNFTGSPDKIVKAVAGGSGVAGLAAAVAAGGFSFVGIGCAAAVATIHMPCSGVITPSAVHGAAMQPAVGAALLMMKDQDEKIIGKEENGMVFDKINPDKAKN